MKGEVVTCFLRHRGKILVLKRSAAVGTYRGRWGGVSGYINEGETPLEAAEREVKEETGITGAELAREGEPVLVEDRDRSWVVHPFLFDVAAGRVVLDWEHDACRWVEAGEVKDLNTVPGLGEVVREALGER